MALTFENMQDYVFAAGLDFLDDAGTGLARVKRAVNDARNEINDEHDGRWPYLEADAVGTAPLVISDLGRIGSVWDTERDRWLEPRDRRELMELYGDNLDDEGIPVWFYVTLGTTVTAYPVPTSGLLSVAYWRTEADMSADADVPLMPDRFRMSIVHLARAKIHRERGNEGQAQAEQNECQRLVDRMTDALMGGMQAWGPQEYVGGYGDDWG